MPLFEHENQFGYRRLNKNNFTKIILILVLFLKKNCKILHQSKDKVRPIGYLLFSSFFSLGQNLCNLERQASGGPSSGVAIVGFQSCSLESMYNKISL